MTALAILMKVQRFAVIPEVNARSHGILRNWAPFMQRRPDVPPPLTSSMNDRPTKPAPIDLSALARREARRSYPEGLEAAPYREIREAFDAHRYDQALAAARALLAQRPGDTEAQRYANACQQALQELHAFATGARQQVPVLLVDRSKVADLKLDHRAGFVVSLIDGLTPVELLADLSPMPAHETFEILFGLLRDGIITLA